MRLRVNAVGIFGSLGLATLLGSCASGNEWATASNRPAPATRSIVNGPAADYPMVLGDPFTIDGITYTPSDAMNVDEVGYATVDAEASGVTASHRTLPLPSYIEVTSLDSGRTALVRVERRGPMTNARLVGLSPGAMAQLGIGEGAPVRLRRVNPPEEHRAELRSDREAPLRMETPPGLLDALRRELPAMGSASLNDPRQAQVSGNVPTPGAIAALDPDTEAAVAQITPPQAAPAVEPQPAATGDFAVQIGAFAVRSNADRLAAKVGGFIDVDGRLALVRTGPYTSRGQAEQALAKLRVQGYSDARIVDLR